jgi:NAD(P)-dependent dehydrogenase (short-subunit alcohol dehydrogenase family)
VLLLGGYGGFGARIARRLVAEGWDVLVAGRSEAKARAFCAGRAGMVPLALDRDRDLAAAIEQWRPFALVDAAGPFQGAGYHVPLACAAAGCHYLDIADGRDFVAGIGALDDAARAGNVSLISGASSVPALSGAAARHLSAGMEEVRAVEIAISASNRASAGPSVTQAILSYVGRPVRVWRGRRWAVAHGWQDMRALAFKVTGLPLLGPRLVGLADVSDLEFLPGRLPGRPAVIFRAGTELAPQNLTMWLLSWLVRWRLIPSLSPFGPALIRLQRLFSRLGTDRSAMLVRVFGLSSGRRLERRWTLIAADGDGPEIPGLAVPILIERLARGEVPPGAMDAGSLLALSEFDPAFWRLSIRHEVTEIQHPPSLYARVMGERFAALPAAVRRMHGVFRDDGASGQAVVTRGRGLLARVVNAAMGFPPDGERALHVSFAEENGVETWTRDFGGHRFRSRLSQRGAYLVERFGPLRFAFDLPGGPQGLAMVLRRWWVGPVPLPLWLAPRSPAREWEEGGRFHLDVPISLPIVGPLVHYRGWLSLRPDTAG